MDSLAESEYWHASLKLGLPRYSLLNASVNLAAAPWSGRANRNGLNRISISPVISVLANHLISDEVLFPDARLIPSYECPATNTHALLI